MARPLLSRKRLVDPYGQPISADGFSKRLRLFDSHGRLINRQTRRETGLVDLSGKPLSSTRPSLKRGFLYSAKGNVVSGNFIKPTVQNVKSAAAEYLESQFGPKAALMLSDHETQTIEKLNAIAKAEKFNASWTALLNQPAFQEFVKSQNIPIRQFPTRQGFQKTLTDFTQYYAETAYRAKADENKAKRAVFEQELVRVTRGLKPKLLTLAKALAHPSEHLIIEGQKVNVAQSIATREAAQKEKKKRQLGILRLIKNKKGKFQGLN